MKCSEVIQILEELAPQSYACSWDNPGFQVGRLEKEVHKILVALDVTDEVVDQAIRIEADMIVSHHPLIFSALKRVNNQDFIGKRMIRMIQADLCYYAMHTNYDVAPGCMADVAAERLGMTEVAVLENTGVTQELQPIGIGKVGNLSEPCMLDELALRVKQVFHIPFVTVFGMKQITEPIHRVAISPGSGKGMSVEAIAKGAKVLITGDIGHHDGIDAVANGLAIIDAGHYGIEHIFIGHVVWYLGEQTNGTVELVKAEPAFPACVIE